MIEKELILLVGPIGSGKTTLAKDLLKFNSIRISQDEMGKKAYMTYFSSAIREGVPRIIIDRMNFNKEQRGRFIKQARDAGYCVTIFEFKTNRELCAQRVVNRTDHPTVRGGDIDLAIDIIKNYERFYEEPTPDEYDNYNEITG